MNPAGFASFNTTTAIPQYGVPYDTRFLPPNRLSSYATFSNPQYGLSFPSVDTLLTKDVTLSADWKINSNLRLASISAYRSYNGYWSYDSDSSPPPPIASTTISATSSSPRKSGFPVRQLAGRLSWTMGGFYYHGRERDDAVIFAALYNLYIDTDSQPYNSNYAGYLHTELELGGGLTFVGGIRQSHESKNLSLCRKRHSGYAEPRIPGRLLFSRPHRLRPLRLSRGPAIPVRADVHGLRGYFHGVSRRRLQPAAGHARPGDRLWAGEAHQLRDRHPQRAFRPAGQVRQHRLLQPLHGHPADREPGGCRYRVSRCGGDQRRDGEHLRFESELQADVNGWLALNAAGSYTHFKYTNLGLAAGLANGPTLDSDQLYTPTWKLNTGAELTLPLLRRFGKLTLNADFSWRSLQYADAHNSAQLAIPAYGLLNARLTLAAHHGWTVSVGGTNVTNQFYYSAKNFISGNYQWKGVPGLPAEWE